MTVRVAVIVMPASQRKGTLKEISVQRGAAVADGLSKWR